MCYVVYLLTYLGQDVEKPGYLVLGDLPPNYTDQLLGILNCADFSSNLAKINLSRKQHLN